MEIKNIIQKLDSEKGKRDLLKSQLKTSRHALSALKDKAKHQEQAREIVREVGLKTQQSLQFHISDITSLALSAVFETPYELKVDFVHRRNKMECDLLFVRNGQEIEPMDASGYGAVDIAAFALRVASWSLMHPKSRNTIILDEPMRFLSVDFQPYASQMLKDISVRLGIQFIIVTHEDTLSQYADKVIQVKQKNSRSIVT